MTRMPAIDGGDQIDSGHVVGSVAGWRDAYRFDGDLELLTLSGPATVTLNGEIIDPDNYGQPLPHVLTVAGVDSSNTYEVSVDGEIEPIAWDESATEANVSSNQTVEGWLEQGDSHRFRFSSEIADATVTEGEVRYYVDGERYEPADSEPVVLPHAIVVDGSDAGRTTYRFAVDGDVIKSSYRDASKNSGDEIQETTASGAVNGGVDAYWFEGNIIDLNVDGDASLDIEYDVHDG
ncbi:MAG: hypothetical protein U5K37_12285 [Natrialbaceae archaeon]|nr:hypothetical protein [Natrialbaceae archaeon]